MAEFRQTYRSGRAMVGIVAFAGWIIAAIGGLVAVAAAISLLSLGQVTGPEAMTTLTALAAGFFVALTAMAVVATVQVMRATFDTADMTRAFLTLAQQTAAAEARQDRRAEREVPDAVSEDDAPKLRPIRAEPAFAHRAAGIEARRDPVISGKRPR